MTTDSVQNKLKENLDEVETQIQAACARVGRSRDEIQLVAVTKSVSNQIAMCLHQLGVIDLGESRPQELWRKSEALPNSVRWHQIGHLQTNKIEKTLPLVHLIHSVDRLRLIDALEKEAIKQNRDINVSLQVNASREEQKHGFAIDELETVLAYTQNLRRVCVQGLMTMAAFDLEPEHCRPAFACLRQLRDQFRSQMMPPHTLEHLSMGMSNDFAVAIEEGATTVRLGSVLFEGINEESA